MLKYTILVAAALVTVALSSVTAQLGRISSGVAARLSDDEVRDTLRDAIQDTVRDTVRGVVRSGSARHVANTLRDSPALGRAAQSLNLRRYDSDSSDSEDSSEEERRRRVQAARRVAAGAARAGAAAARRTANRIQAEYN